MPRGWYNSIIMEVRDYYSQFDECREHEIPMCADACPFRLDIIDIRDRIAKKRYNAAYKTLRDSVAFPGIVAEICPAYCEQVCIRNIIDAPVRINLLEKTLIAKAKRKDPNAYNLPAKSEKIAVIGAGLSGMGFASRMASRKYNVTIFEKSGQIGGQLSDLMDEEAYKAEFDLQLKHEKYEVRLNTEITDLEPLASEYNVIYIATGKGGSDFGVPMPEPITNEDGSSDYTGGCMTIGDCGIFIGGSVCGDDAVHSLASGLNIASCAEDYIKVRQLSYPKQNAPTKCVANELKLVKTPAAEPSEDVPEHAAGGHAKAVQSDGANAVAEQAESANPAHADALTAGNADKTDDSTSASSSTNVNTNEPAARETNAANVANKASTAPTEHTGLTNEAPVQNRIFTDAECLQEAERCIKCQCDACDTYCDIVGYYQKWPLKMRDELFLSVKPAGSLVHKCPSRKYIAACTDCDILRDTCPGDIDLCGMVKAARHQMVTADKMPAGFSQYYLRDMDFANGEYAYIKKNHAGSAYNPGNPAEISEDAGNTVKAEYYPANADESSEVSSEETSEGAACAGKPADGSVSDSSPDKVTDTGCPAGDAKNGSCEYAFFPGCNLGALDPDYVIKPYKWLLSQMPDAGLLLRCCGVPCDWSGNGEIHEKELADLKADWESMGCPVLITACMYCEKHLAEYLPEIETVSIYEIMSERGITAEGSTGDTVYSIFDPCAARNNDNVQDSIRDLAAKAGVCVEELPEGAKHGCCGFGGQGDIAQGEFSKYVADKRSALSPNPYIVYCSNCRDVFTGNGKQAVHILDVLFDINLDNAGPEPNVSQRRENRVILKERLLDEIWGEQMEAKPEKDKYILEMSDDIAKKINRQKILTKNICDVIERAEQTGRRTINPDNGHYKAYHEIGAVTVWVEYTADESRPDVRIIHNVYSHRMQIKLEAIFNGKKIDEE